MTLAKKLDDPGVWMEALFLMGVTLFYRGDFAGARQQYETALAQYDDRERTRIWALRVGEHAGVTHRCYLALTLWHLGYAEEALKVNREMLELARSIDHPFSLAYALHHTSWLYQYLRLPEETLVSATSIRSRRTRGFRCSMRPGSLQRLAARCCKARPRGVPGLNQGPRRLSRHRRRARAPLLSRASRRRADPDGRPVGSQSDLEALCGCRGSDERCHEAELFRLEGNSPGAMAKEPNQLEAIFLRAIETARKQKSKAWELRATTSLARLYQAQNRREQAQAILGQALGGFTEGFGTPDLRDARTLLEELRAD